MIQYNKTTSTFSTTVLSLSTAQLYHCVMKHDRILFFTVQRSHHLVQHDCSSISYNKSAPTFSTTQLYFRLVQRSYTNVQYNRTVTMFNKTRLNPCFDRITEASFSTARLPQHLVQRNCTNIKYNTTVLMYNKIRLNPYL